jgi:hypothetical protein
MKRSHRSTSLRKTRLKLPKLNFSRARKKLLEGHENEQDMKTLIDDLSPEAETARMKALIDDLSPEAENARVKSLIDYFSPEAERARLVKRARPIVAQKLAEQSAETNPARKTALAWSQARILCQKTTDGELLSLLDSNEIESMKKAFAG